MGTRINQVAVLGAGVMGQGIAAHLANAGIPSLLFDIAPAELTDQEAKKGLTLEDREVRNRISAAGYASMLKAKPALLYHKDLARLVTPCNYEDDADKLGDVDWIVEVVVERLDVKQKIFAMVDERRKPGSIVSSNTSGLSVGGMVEGRSDDFRKHFLVTHFFNPVRYMRLLELVPCEDTDPGLLADMAEFGTNVLGKGIVYGKDTPNFVGNRIGTFGMTSVFHWMEKMGVGVTEADKIFGPATGRPKSGVFRTADVVGLDTMAHVLTTVAESSPDDPWRERFIVPEVLQKLIERGDLGEKTGAGFYKKTRDADGKRKILVLNFETLEYEEQPKVRFDSIGAARKLEAAADKIREVVWFDDKAGHLAWKVTAETCIYSAQLLGEITDDIVNVDRALRWGFNYELGPFETWDAIGVERSVRRMREEGMTVPGVVETLLAKGDGTWYVRRDGTLHYWDVFTEEYLPVPGLEGIITIADLAVLDSNEGATLFDMGDGVGLLEFHTKMNSIDAQIIEMMDKACDWVNEGRLVGLVVGNEAANFSVGANIGLVGMLAMSNMWDELEGAVRGIQNAYMKMKYCEGPVVAAPRGLTLGGGCEAVMHSDAVRAFAETYMGLVELGVGLIPAGGGCKEMAFRYYGSVPVGVDTNMFPFMEKIFKTIGMATVSTSAEEARDLGYLRPTDKVHLNSDTLLASAKKDVLALVETGYSPPRQRTVTVPGRDGIAAIGIAAHTMRGGGYISEYDEHLAKRLAYVICGGDVAQGTERSEQDFLDLEREVFVELCHEEKTLERIQHMLATGKPLRN
ncbi:MAG: 3-hydroxyacyl-CoA dehydrogenase [Gammaproteobacteria bacterium]|nr:3-hydroxyacyl-CoA dehydrogenase [Gammaproteobacteria bacterium]